MTRAEVCAACGGKVTALVGTTLAAALDVHVATCPAAIRQRGERRIDCTGKR